MAAPPAGIGVSARSAVVAAGYWAATTTTADNATSVATDQAFSGFTLGAALLAVLAAGTYWYYRR